MATGAPNGNGNGHGNGKGNGNGNGNGLKNGLYGFGGSGQEQIREILHVLFKRWRLAALLFIVVALPGLVLIYAREDVYVATAKVLITTQRADLTVQPSDLTRLTTINLNESTVNSEVHIIRSRELLENVVERLENGSNGFWRKNGNGNGNGNGDGDSAKRRFLGRKVLRLADQLRVTPIKNSNVIQVDYRAAKPKYATQVVNRVIDEYLSHHAEVHGTKGLTRFYEDQRNALTVNLRRAENALREFAVREGIVHPVAEIEASVRAIAETDAMLREVNATINGLEEKIRITEQQVMEQPSEVKWYEYIEVNPVVQTLGEQLAERKIDRIALLRKYTGKDRLVRDNAEEIAALKDELETESRERPTVTGREILRNNPVREDRMRVLLNMQSQVREQRARRAALEEQLSRASRLVVQLKTKSLEYDQLQQDVDNWRSTAELYIKREEEARVSEAMDEEKMVNVEVVQRPALPLPRAGRKRSSAMLALLSAMIVSLAGAFGVEYLNRTLKSERDVEQYLGLPLLASVPDTESE